MGRLMFASLGGALVLCGFLCIPWGNAIWAHSYKGFGFREGLVVADTVKGVGIALCAGGLAVFIKAVWKRRRPQP